MLCDRAGILSLGVVLFPKDNRKRARAYAVSTQDTDQAAGIDAAGKKHSHRHIAHQLHAHRLIEHLRYLRFEFIALLRACAGVIAAFIKVGPDQVPILLLLHLPFFPGEIATGRERIHTFH